MLHIQSVTLLLLRPLTTDADTVNAPGNVLVTGLANTTANSTNSTLQAVDTIRGNGSNDTLRATYTNAAGTTDATNGALISGVENFEIRNTAASGSGAVALDASKDAGLTRVASYLSGGDITVTNLATGAKVAVVGDNTVVSGDVGFAYAAAAGTLGATATVDLAGGIKATAIDITLNQTGTTGNIQNFVVNSVGVNANAIKSLNVQGTGAAAVNKLTVNAAIGTNLTAVSGFAASASILVNGAAANTATAAAVTLGTLEASTVLTVDASGLTAGGVSTTLNAAITSFKGGAGNDTVTTAATTATGAVINAGAGTADVLILASVNDVTTAAKGAQYVNFDVLKSLVTSAVNASVVVGTTSVVSAAAGAGFTNLNATQAAAVTNLVDQTAITYALTSATGTSDVLNITAQNATATSTANLAGLTVTGFETLNVTASSGGSTVVAKTAGTDYTNVSFAGAANLTTVTLNGANAVGLDISSNATAVTSVSAINNTAGVKVTTGGQAAAMTVTGSNAADIVSLGSTTGVQTINTGLGNDSVLGAQTVIAAAIINGQGGTDTLTFTDTGATVVADATFANVSGMEAFVLNGTGATWVVGGYANTLATANAGVLNITAASLATAAADASTFDARSLSGTNSLNLTATMTDSVATTLTGNLAIYSSNAGTDSITLSTAAASGKVSGSILIDASANTSSGVTITATSLAGVLDVGKTIAVKGGSGADTINFGGQVASITGGAAADHINLTAADGKADTLVYNVANQSTTTAYDIVSGYQMVATNADKVNFASTTLLTGSVLGTGWTITNGIATKTGATLSDYINAFSTSTTAGVSAFFDGSNTYVAYSDGTASVTTSDQVVELVGITTATAVATTTGSTTITIV